MGKCVRVSRADQRASTNERSKISENRDEYGQRRMKKNEAERKSPSILLFEADKKKFTSVGIILMGTGGRHCAKGNGFWRSIFRLTSA